MIKIENTVAPSAEQWKATIRGMRNPMNSWKKSDTDGHKDDSGTICLGINDITTMSNLFNEGKPNRKFMRMLPVYADVTAPLYWWKEYDTYKVGTVANSCSTMHKIHAKEFTLNDFSHEHLISDEPVPCTVLSSMDYLNGLINALNKCRDMYLRTKDKKWWWQMIQLLPSSYNQKRTVMLNYEVLSEMYYWRHNHKLDEWHAFCDWIKTLPYSDVLITGEIKMPG